MVLDLKPFNYDIAAGFYDTLELEEPLNDVIVKSLITILQKNNCQRVWDAACGTGAQSIPLAEAGFEVIASDICSSMLSLAREKTQKVKAFNEGDMRTYKPGQVDAVIVMMNSLGHLSVQETAEACQNFGRNMPVGGVLIGDVDNRQFLENNLTHQPFISRFKLIQGEKFIRQTRALKVGGGVYEIDDHWFSKQRDIFAGSCQIQSWYRDDLEKVLHNCGFKVLQWCNRRFKTLDDSTDSLSDSLLFVAAKN